jgi:hypothetical protein
LQPAANDRRMNCKNRLHSLHNYFHCRQLRHARKTWIFFWTYHPNHISGTEAGHELQQKKLFFGILLHKFHSDIHKWASDNLLSLSIKNISHLEIMSSQRKLC